MSDQIIRRFQLHGTTASPWKRRELELQLLAQMYDEGYAQLLDIDTTFKTDYLVDKDVYNFALTIQGVYVGDEPWNTVVTAGRTIRKTQSAQ